ncbi:ABC transporter ATP-binding protein [Virgibacillus dakarensis]|uniref:ABC transporter ATP-binding protein n=1 Tax=Virgibacillus dakarensis TaxID=1917889 RepID=UPI000B453BA8|nr:ABC transporter ATP-binding protein [Virgibacillus dakarensis]
MITITNVTKFYGKKEALKQISLSISEGSCFGLVGPNGAGKSTLLKIIASIIQDYHGNIQVTNGRNRKEEIGYVPQEICLEQTLSAYSNLCFFGKLYGLKGKTLQHRATEVLHQIGLADRVKDKVLHFSGGMKRRLNIGCALMHQPKLIIMDEPTVGIDPQSRRYIFEMIQRLQQKGCTIICASHYMEEVEQLCDEVAFMDHGKTIHYGKTGDLLQQYAIPAIFVKGTISLPKEMERFGEVSPHKDGYLLTTKTPLSAMEEVLMFYKIRDNGLERLELVRPRLEDVFFTVTGNKLRDEII